MSNNDTNTQIPEHVKNPYMDYSHIEFCSADREHSILKVTLSEELKNPYGSAHGGLLFTMTDCAAGYLATQWGGRFVTENAHMNFINNVKSGTLTAKGSLVKAGRLITIVRVQIFDEEGRLLTDATVNMLRVINMDL